MSEQSSSSPGHWSKDFVEHLRTVHFALIGVSTGLILIVLMAKPYDPTVALSQLRQVLELKKHWSADWLTANGRAEKKVFGAYGNSANVTKLSAVGEKDEWDKDPILPASPHQESLLPEGNILIPNNVFYGLGDKYVSYGRPHPQHLVQFSIRRCCIADPEWSPTTFVSTLSDFRAFWNSLNGQTFTAILPRTLEANLGSFETTDALGQHSISLSILKNSNLQIQPRSIPEDRVELSLTDPRNGELDFEGSGKIGPYYLRVRRFIYLEITQKAFTDYFKWQPGPFDTSFADLAQATRDIQTRDLTDVESVLEGEVLRGEAFEAFGMKFPVSHITLWGIVVLEGVQLYLLVYLKQLAGKLAADDAGWDVPWIGMDTSGLARTLFFLSIVVLPCVSTILLLGHYLLERRKVFSGCHWVYVAALIGALVSCIALSFISWKYRPRLTQVARETSSPKN